MTYTGNGTSPSVTIVAITNHMAMMDMMMGADSNIGMNGSQSGMTMTTTARSQTGSAIVYSGWQSGSRISVMLDGEGTAHDASDIHLMVFPHLT